MSDLKTLLRIPERLVRRSLGLPLVMLGFFLVYFNVLGTQAKPTLGVYLVFAFGCALTLAGLGFMAVELRRIGGSTTTVQSAVSSSDLELTSSSWRRTWISSGSRLRTASSRHWS